MVRVERPDMAVYGVPDDLVDALPWSWAAERLVRSRNYWVVTATPMGRPHAMPVWGVWLAETERFGFSCAPTARKSRNLSANPAITIAVDDTVEVVSLEGRAERLVEPDALDAFIAAYVAKYAEPDTEGLRAEQMDPFVRQHDTWSVTPERAFGIIERADEFAARATRWRW